MPVRARLQPRSARAGRRCAAAWRAALALLLGLLPAAAGADDYEREREELEALREELTAVEERLEADHAARDQAGEALERLDRRVAEAARRLREARERRGAARERVARLRRERAEQDQRLEAHRRVLREQLTAAYTAGGEGRLKMLLNAQRPAAAQRLLVYYDYLHEARGERIAAAVAELRRLAELRRRLREEVDRLERLEAELVERRERLAERRAERRSRRQALERRIAERGEAAERLEERVAEQEDLLERLRERLADIPDEAGAARGLREEIRGELPWPVQGPLEARFGESRGGGLKRKGIVVGAEPGTDVQAVAAGRVVFSDWLRGLGLLVIIDHGDGYLTLYGHNQALYVEVGEWLEAGDLLGSVGSSGARGEPGLYFGIRHGEEPENPLAWLR